MLKNLEPHLHILPDAQKKLWPDLIQVPHSFTLYGGTAIALQLGHRISIDFDFFGNGNFDPDQLYRKIPFLKNATVIQKEENTLTCLVGNHDPVQVSFFGLPDITPIKNPFILKDIQLKVASLLDLAGMKAAVVQKRAEAKDYIDMDALLQTNEINLSLALSAGQLIYGSSFNPQITLKALSYFDDLNNLDKDIKLRLTNAVKSVDLDKLPSIHREIS